MRSLFQYSPPRSPPAPLLASHSASPDLTIRFAFNFVIVFKKLDIYTSLNIAAGRIVAGGAGLLPEPVTFICLTPRSLARASTASALESHLVTPLQSKLSKARSADAEVSGMERVMEEEEERGNTELSRVRKKGEWKSRRSELMQILAPGNLLHGGQ